MTPLRWGGIGALIAVSFIMFLLGKKSRRRTMTAIVAAAVALAAVWGGGWVLAAGIMVLSFFAGRELFWLFAEKGYHPASGLGRLVALAFLPLVALTGTRYLTVALVLGLLAAVVVLVIRGAPQLLGFQNANPHAGQVSGIADLATTWLGMAYVGWLPSYIVLVRMIPGRGLAFTYLFFFTLIGTDIGAYLVGKRLGRHPLIGPLSPNKTVEGALGGTLSGMGVAVLVGFIGGLPLAPCLGLGAAISLAGQLSDLSESMIKRDAGKKDSGHALPGHGGILDRVDSYLLSAPVAYYYLLYLWPRFIGH